MSRKGKSLPRTALHRDQIIAGLIAAVWQRLRQQTAAFTAVAI